MMKRLVLAAGLALALAACEQQAYESSGRHLSPIPPATMSLMASKGMSKSDPILMRLYKKESELEVWKRGRDGQYALLKTYPICRWSGQLGPKIREGDRQAPEGFYTVTPAMMNPNSSFHLSFNTGFPNAFDRAHGRTGSHLMVHGSCSSRGCYAMTDEAISEVYALAREAFSAGQRGFQLQAMPFRMTAENLAKHRYDPNMAFWKNLKEGADHFEVTKAEPRVEVCGRRYAFNTENCSPADPSVVAAVAAKNARDEQQVAALVADGTPAVKLVYEDGGGHPSFRDVAVATLQSEGSFPVLEARSRRNLGEVSRPEALAMGPREILIDSSGKPKDAPTALAFAATATPPRSAVAAASAPAVQPRSEQPVASAPAAAPAATVAGGEDKADERPFYRRMLGDIFSTRLLGGGEEQPAAAPAPVPPTAAVPVPPRRGASLPPTDRRAETQRAPQAGAPAGALGYVSLN